MPKVSGKKIKCYPGYEPQGSRGNKSPPHSPPTSHIYFKIKNLLPFLLPPLLFLIFLLLLLILLLLLLISFFYFKSFIYFYYPSNSTSISTSNFILIQNHRPLASRSQNKNACFGEKNVGGKWPFF